MAELSAIVDRLAGDLGAAAAPPVALGGGITNRNYRVRFGQRECVLRLPGRDPHVDGVFGGAVRL
jgi:hypothetical protein